MPFIIALQHGTEFAIGKNHAKKFLPLKSSTYSEKKAFKIKDLAPRSVPEQIAGVKRFQKIFRNYFSRGLLLQQGRRSGLLPVPEFAPQKKSFKIKDLQKRVCAAVQSRKSTPKFYTRRPSAVPIQVQISRGLSNQSASAKFTTLVRRL